MRICMSMCTITLLLVCCSRCMAQQYITPVQAEQAVRAFQSEPGIQFESTLLREDPSDPSWIYDHYYILTCTSGRDDFWEVDARNGEVYRAFYGNAHPTESTESPFGPLTRAECFQIAEAYARAKYSDFDAMGLSPVPPNSSQDWTGKGWSFMWQQKVAYDATTPNGVSVDVSPADGRIQEYCSFRVTTPTPSEPEVTPQDAIASAQQATGIVTITESGQPVLVAEPGRTYWALTIKGQDSQGKSRFFGVEVDAYTGVALNTYEGAGPAPAKHVAQATGAVQSSKSPTTSKGGLAWASARSMLTAIGCTIAWEPGRHILLATSTRGKIVLQVGKRIASVYGRNVVLAQSPRLVKGRVQVPSSFADLIRN